MKTIVSTQKRHRVPKLSILDLLLFFESKKRHEISERKKGQIGLAPNLDLSATIFSNFYFF